MHRRGLATGGSPLGSNQTDSAWEFGPRDVCPLSAGVPALAGGDQAGLGSCRPRPELRTPDRTLEPPSVATHFLGVRSFVSCAAGPGLEAGDGNCSVERGRFLL